MKHLTYTKIISAFLCLPLLLTACSAGMDSKGRVEVNIPSNANTPGQTTPGSTSSDPSPTKAGGGVDVGNLTTYLVPMTEVALNANSEWTQIEEPKRLVLRTRDNSEIRGQLVVLKDVVSPNIESLEKYVQRQTPNRKVSRFVLNGSPAVEVAPVVADDIETRQIYLLNDNGQVILVDSSLKTGSRDSGAEVLNSTRILYRGEAIKSSGPKTITLDGRTRASNQSKSAFNFKTDCYSYEQSCGRGVDLGFMAYDGKPNFSVGLAGYDTGRIIKLGTSSEIDFASIRTEGKFLIAKGENVPLADIYTLFTPDNFQINQSGIPVEEGAVYLVRTISWPDEDLITKFKVNKVTETAVEMTYEKLTQIPESILKKQVEAMNEYTRKFEQPKSEGEVVLYNRSIFESYSHAAFNFQFSTSGNPYITYNSWQVLYGFGCDGKPNLSASSSRSGISRIYKSTKTKIADITMADMPNPNDSVRDCGQGIEVGGIYLIDTYDFAEDSGHIAGAVQVMEIEKELKWVRLKFRRLVVEKAKDFVRWEELPVQPEHVKTNLEFGNGQKGIYSLFTATRADVRSYYHEKIGSYHVSDKPSLYIDPRPYLSERGFIKLSSDSFGKTDLAKAREILKSAKPERGIIPQKGDVYLINLKTFHTYIIAVMRIDEVQGEKSVTISVKDLFKAKAPYNSELP